MGCGLLWGLTPVATRAHASAPDHRRWFHLRKLVSTGTSNGLGLLRHLRPPLPRVLLIPRGRVWTGRARETARGQRATPYPPGQCPHAPGLGGERLGGHPPLGCTASGEGGRGPRRGAKPPAGTPARTPAFRNYIGVVRRGMLVSRQTPPAPR